MTTLERLSRLEALGRWSIIAILPRAEGGVMGEIAWASHRESLRCRFTKL
jgi:hypothetical protein